MNIKKKLILIGVCFIVIILVLVANIVRRMKVKDEDNLTNEVIVKEKFITRAEAYRLLSFLKYDKAGREALANGITYADTSMSGWYDIYVNAVSSMGLIDNKVTISPKEALTYGACKEMLDKLILNNTKYQNVYMELSFDFIKADEGMQIEHFLETYDAIISIDSSKANPIQKELILVLGKESMQGKNNRIITDQGLYNYQDSMDYAEIINQMEASKNNRQEGLSETISPTSSASDKAIAKKATATMNSYLDKGIKVITRGQEIIYIISQTSDKIVISNTWIKQGQGTRIDTYINGLNKSFTTQYKLSSAIESVVGDVTIENGKIVQISIKPDIIKGKVLLTGEDYIELEGYGKVDLDEDFRIYKLYGELSMEPTGSILVGYDNTDFVVSQGKISAALIREGIKARNIRILLHTSGYSSIYHEEVKFTANTDFTVKSGEVQTSYTKGEIITVRPGDELMKEGRIIVLPSAENGKVDMLSIDRTDGSAKYRGHIEITEDDEGLLVVNELPLEEYLYSVIPSEMPTYYGIEPLKVQAICARSYAYKHLLANSLSKYGAHADDSVSFQVYNNIPENEDSILAVKDTYGKVIEYNGEVITAYYFSTSCGHTTGIEYVWADGKATPYLQGRLMAVEEETESASNQSNLQIYQDLSKEENFRSFLADTDFPTYDSSYNWYRWIVTLDAKAIENTINDKLATRYNAYPNLIQTLVSGSVDEGNAVFESRPIETIGKIEDIRVLKRETGGIIYELLIVGSENTIKLQTEYNIRVFLSPKNNTVYRLDGKGVDNLSLLPSAFFIIDKKLTDGELVDVTLSGGGYGHGVGMSQNGVKALSDAGRKYDEIIEYFYEGTELGLIYN